MDINPDDLLVWSDDHLLACNKPSGLLSLPDGYDPSQPHLKSVLEPDFGTLWIVHRLDRGTSGIIILGRSKQAHKHLNTQFQEGMVKKTYHALVIGSPSWEENRVELPLLPDGDRKHRTVVDTSQGKASITEFQVMRRLQALSLLEARPKTGRTHQIRAHLSAIGYPICGDPLYGEVRRRMKSHFPRLGLHARKLVFKHPKTGESLSLEAPYPEDFKELLTGTSG